MKNPRFIILSLVAWMLSCPLWADSGHTFPEEGKVYLIHRFSDQNSYIYENGGLLNASASMNTQKQYWKFEPTSKANCYYVRNVTTGNYVQSSYAVGCEQQIKTGSEPVEFQIVKNTTSGATPYGYYYIASTDQTINTSGDTSLGLNYQQSTGKVVAYWIRYNRPNSYWDIVETAYNYEAPEPVSHTALQKRLGVYHLPCGTAGAAWIKSLSVSGTAENVADALNYTSSSKPSDYYLLVRKDSATVHPGKVFTLAYKATGVDNNYAVTAYFDWNKDGVFEASREFGSQAEASVEIAVPDTATLGVVRFRLRLTSNGMEGADEDVEGRTCDFLLNLSKADTQSAIQEIIPSSPQQAADDRAYSTEGKRVRLETHKGVYIQNGQKKIK